MLAWIWSFHAFVCVSCSFPMIRNLWLYQWYHNRLNVCNYGHIISAALQSEICEITNIKASSVTFQTKDPMRWNRSSLFFFLGILFSGWASWNPRILSQSYATAVDKHLLSTSSEVFPITMMSFTRNLCLQWNELITCSMNVIKRWDFLGSAELVCSTSSRLRCSRENYAECHSY